MAVSTQNQPLAVAAGAKVLIEVNGELQEWEIVDVGKSDIQNGKISCEAPLARLILGARNRDKVIGKIMDNEITVVVKKVSLI